MTSILNKDTINITANRIFSYGEGFTIPTNKTNVKNIVLSIIRGNSYYNTGFFNYYWFTDIIALNKYDTNYFEPDSNQYILDPLISFPLHNSEKYVRDSVPVSQIDSYSILWELDIKRVHIVKGNLKPIKFTMVSANSNPDCYYGDYTHWKYYMQPHETIKSTGRIMKNTLNLFQTETVTYDMFDMFKHHSNKAYYIIKMSSMSTVASLDFIYFLYRLFDHVKLIKPTSSNWMIDTFFVVCSSVRVPFTFMDSIRGMSGSIASLFSHEERDPVFMNKISSYIMGVNGVIWMMNASLIHILEHPSKDLKNVIWQLFKNYQIKETKSKEIIHNKHMVANKTSKMWKFEQNHAHNERGVKDVQNLYLYLNDLVETRAWDSKFKELPKIHNGGQIKLLLNEMIFMANIVDLLPLKKRGVLSNNTILVVYIGSAPGSHLNLLMSMFRAYDLEWHLYDTVKHAQGLAAKGAKIHAKYFDSSEADKMKALTKPIILISDIRTTGLYEPTFETINEDNILQWEFVKQLNPIATNLKYRLPFSTDFETIVPITDKYINPLKLDNVIETLDKREYVSLIPESTMLLQSFQLHTSAEFRCSFRGVPPLLGVTKYMATMIEELMFYYNTRIRFTERKPTTEVEWVCKCHNCCIMIYTVDELYKNIEHPYSSLEEMFQQFVSDIKKIDAYAGFE